MSGIIHEVGNVIWALDDTAAVVLNADLRLGFNLPATSCMETHLTLHKGARLVVHGDFKAFYGSRIELFPDAVLELDRGYINAGASIACASHITIGSGVAIGRGVMIYDKATSYIMNTEKIKQVAPAFACAIPFREGIGQTLAFYRAHPLRMGTDSGWDAQMDALIAGYGG